jgi:hypothetical protein
MAVVCVPVSITSFVLFLVFRKRSPWFYFLLILSILALIPIGFWIYMLVAFNLTGM